MAKTILAIFRALPPARKTLVIQFLALTTVNGWLSCVVTLATVVVTTTYRHWDMTLPVLTAMTFPFGMLWPVAALLISIIGVVVAFKSRPSERFLSHVLITTALLELTILGLHLIALVLPLFKVDYSMGGG